MHEALGCDSFPYFGEEHTLLRHTIRRFIADRVLPVADRWEEQGYVPREILTAMGALGLLGMRYAPEYGGQGLDTLAGAVLRMPARSEPASGSVMAMAVSLRPAVMSGIQRSS